MHIKRYLAITIKHFYCSKSSSFHLFASISLAYTYFTMQGWANRNQYTNTLSSDKVCDSKWHVNAGCLFHCWTGETALGTDFIFSQYCYNSIQPKKSPLTQCNCFNDKTTGLPWRISWYFKYTLLAKIDIFPHSTCKKRSFSSWSYETLCTALILRLYKWAFQSFDRCSWQFISIRGADLLTIYDEVSEQCETMRRRTHHPHPACWLLLIELPVGRVH